MAKWNIKPVHKNFQTLGSTHTAFYSPYKNSNKAFLSFQALTDTHTFKTSGYQYYGSISTNLVSASGEVVNVTDSGFIGYTIFAAEPLRMDDSAFLGRLAEDEAVSSADSGFVTYTIFADEPVRADDSASSSSVVPEVVNSADSGFVSYIIHADEGIQSSDGGQAFQSLDATDTVKIMICTLLDATDTVKVGTSGSLDATDTVCIGIVPETLASVTSASGTYLATPNNPIVLDPNNSTPTPLPFPFGDVTYNFVTNPFEPSIILDGLVYASSVSTFPPTYGAQTNFVQWLDISLPGGNNSSNVFDFSFNLSFDGGGFSVLATNSLGDLGEEITIFGLNGTLTILGQKFSNSAYGYTAKGIFGTAKLNREFRVITNGMEYFLQFVGSQTLYPAGANISGNNPDGLIQTGIRPKNAQIPTVSSMCAAIAAAVGVTVGFYVTDAPLLDLTGQSGQTGLQALSSLASLCGGQLRWSGESHYSIVPPNFFQGRYDVPGTNLLTAEGIEYDNILDLGLGVSGTGVMGLPYTNPFDTATNVLPDTPVEIIERHWSTSKALTSDDPATIVEFPADVFAVKYQILVQGTVDAGAPPVVTTDPNNWEDFPGNIAPGQTTVTYYADSSPNLNPNVSVDFTLFPNIDAVNNGNFVMNLGFTRSGSLADAFAAAQLNQLNRLASLIARFLANTRYVKTYEGTINCFFSGVIPIPGMWCSATNICGETVEGIIESVSFNAPGVLTIQVAQYLRVNLLDTNLSAALQKLGGIVI